MKAGWQTKSLGDILKKIETINPLQAPDTKFDYIDVSSVSNQTFHIEQSQRLRGKDAPSRARRLVKANDVLFATVRPTLQRIAIVPDELDNQICSTGYFVLRPKSDIDHRFVYYFLFTEDFMWQMEKIQKGTSYPAVTDNEVRAQKIAFPPLPEQQRIVGILDEAFAGITTAKANAEKNRKNARALFESHLQAVFVRTADEIPLFNLATEITDGDHTPPPKSSCGVPFITISDIVKQTREIDFSNTFKVSEEYFRKLKPNKRPLLGDVLYTVTGATLGIPVLVKEERGFCFQRHIGLIRPKADTDSSWLSYALLSPQVFRQATLGATGAAQKTVSLSLLRNLMVPKMRLTEQRAIAAQLDALSAETQRLESLYQQKLAALEALKKSLLHQAFTGAL